MEKRQQRTPQEIIAETEARLERLRLKEAKQQAKTDPTISPLLDEMDELAKEIREAKKLLGSGPQSAEARIAKHGSWIDRIQEEVAAAHDALASAEERKAELQAEIVSATLTLLNSPKEISAEG